MLFTCCCTATCPDRWVSDPRYLFHNAPSQPPATAQRPFAPCLGKYAQVHSGMARRRFFFSLYLSPSGGEEAQSGLNLLMDSSVFNNYRWSRGRCHSRLKYLDLTCMDSHCIFFYGGDICNIQRMSRMSLCDPL